jgi:hypothetical protein
MRIGEEVVAAGLLGAFSSLKNSGFRTGAVALMTIGFAGRRFRIRLATQSPPAINGLALLRLPQLALDRGAEFSIHS